MAQSNYTVANQTFPATRSNLNSIFAALKSSNSGSSAPADKSQGTVWFDTTENLLKIRNSGDSAWEVVRKMGTQLPVAITSSTSLTAENNRQVIRVDAGSGNVTITLPLAADGFEVKIVKIDSSPNQVIIQRAASDLINGLTDIRLFAQWEDVTLFGASGSLWFSDLDYNFGTPIRGRFVQGLTSPGFVDFVNAAFGLHLVFGRDNVNGREFQDLVLSQPFGSKVVVSSTNFNSPATRTYSDNGGGTLRLTLSSSTDTYAVLRIVSVAA
jgi:hypothetical protein